MHVMGSKPPAIFDRAGRVKLLAEAFKALMNGQLPSREAALLVGGGGIACLGRITKPCWRQPGEGV